MNIIYQIVPEDTPLMNLIGRKKATNVKHEWLVRQRGARVGTDAQNVKVPGGEIFTTDFSLFESVAAATRDINYCEIFRVLVSVDETTLAMNAHGVEDIMADQIRFRMEDFAIYIESEMFNGAQAAGPTATTATAQAVAWAMGGLVNEIVTNTLSVGTGTLSDANMATIFADIWADGGRPQDLFCGPNARADIDALTGGATKFLDVDQRRVINTVGVYEGSTQTVMLHLTRDSVDTANAANAHIVDRSHLNAAWLREPFIERLPRFAGAECARIEGQVTLEFGDQLAHGEITSI
jgi:hypothetical protein